MASKRERVPLNPQQTGLNAAFSGLDISGLPAGPAESPAAPAAERPKPGRVVLRKEKAGRGGKTVIVIDDFAAHFSDDQIDQLAKRLRNVCGCGGSVKERKIEMQGDQPERVRAALEAEGFRVGGV